MERLIRSVDGVFPLESLLSEKSLTEDLLLELDKKFYRHNSIPSLDALLEILNRKENQKRK